jgi:hypothetical protein
MHTPRFVSASNGLSGFEEVVCHVILPLECCRQIKFVQAISTPENIAQISNNLSCISTFSVSFTGLSSFFDGVK